MVRGKTITAVFVAVTVVAVLFGPLSAVVTSGTGDVDVDNEQQQASVGDWQSLDGYHVVEDSETVERYNETSGSWETVQEGTDYEIDNEPGQLRALEGGAIEDGDDLRVTYTYAATDGQTGRLANMIPLFLAILILVTIAVPVMRELD